MKKLPKILLLYSFNLVIFCTLFASSFFDASIFKSVSLSLAQIPLPEVLRSVVLLFWMIVPQTLVLYIANKTYFKLPMRKFLLLQAIFAISVAMLLFVVFKLV